MNVGFIDLGEMGRRMAARLLGAGHSVRAWNRTQSAAADLTPDGLSIAATPDEAFDGDAVISMLADDTAVRAVFLESDLLGRTSASPVHVNMATISVGLATEMAERHEERSIPYVAAPVLGRPDLAAAGKLTIISAGPRAAIARVQPLLDALGQGTWNLGEKPADANVAKLAANLLLTSAIETMAEAAVLLSGHGVIPATFFDIVTNSTFPGPVYGTYGRLIADARYEPAGFKARLALKDIRLALAAADARSIPLPVASTVRDSLLDAGAHGEGDQDCAVLGRVAARRAGRS
jgi:3-hydroxyisobutyrate dehydrogenase-like beta-hydroxyacid dehydrogenase